MFCTFTTHQDFTVITWTRNHLCHWFLCLWKQRLTLHLFCDAKWDLTISRRYSQFTEDLTLRLLNPCYLWPLALDDIESWCFFLLCSFRTVCRPLFCSASSLWGWLRNSDVILQSCCHSVKAAAFDFERAAASSVLQKDAASVYGFPAGTAL